MLWKDHFLLIFIVLKRLTIDFAEIRIMISFTSQALNMADTWRVDKISHSSLVVLKLTTQNIVKDYLYYIKYNLRTDHKVIKL